jgi:hypothetical protein
LEERGGYEICILCNWEDDGQDDPHADEVWGGPNQDYSLAEARKNFKRYLIMYDPARPLARTNSPTMEKAKLALIKEYEGITAETDRTAQRELWLRASEAEATLWKAGGG